MLAAKSECHRRSILPGVLLDRVYMSELIQNADLISAVPGMPASLGRSEAGREPGFRFLPVLQRGRLPARLRELRCAVMVRDCVVAHCRGAQGNGRKRSWRFKQLKERGIQYLAYELLGYC